MSIASITTFGFGSFSTVNLAVVLGYVSSSTPPVTISVDTHDYPLVYEDAHRRNKARLKRLAKATEDRQNEKIAQLQLLRNQLRGIPPEEEPVEIAETSPVAPPMAASAAFKLPPVNRALLEQQITLLVNQIMQINKQKQQEIRKIRDENDMMIILKCLNN